MNSGDKSQENNTVNYSEPTPDQIPHSNAATNSRDKFSNKISKPNLDDVCNFLDFIF